MGAHSAEEPVNGPVNQPVNDPGNSGPGAFTVDLDDDELAELLAFLAEEDEIRDNQLAAARYDSGGVLPPGLATAVNTTGQDETIRPAGAW